MHLKITSRWQILPQQSSLHLKQAHFCQLMHTTIFFQQPKPATETIACHPPPQSQPKLPANSTKHASPPPSEMHTAFATAAALPSHRTHRLPRARLASGPPLMSSKPPNERPPMSAGLVGGLPLWAAATAVQKMLRPRRPGAASGHRGASEAIAGKLRLLAGEFETEKAALQMAVCAERERADVAERKLKLANKELGEMRMMEDSRVKRIVGVKGDTTKKLFDELSKAQVRAAKAEKDSASAGELVRVVGKEKAGKEGDVLAMASLGVLSSFGLCSFFLHAMQTGDVSQRLLKMILGGLGGP